jgi:hypothetical protein
MKIQIETRRLFFELRRIEDAGYADPLWECEISTVRRWARGVAYKSGPIRAVAPALWGWWRYRR